MDYEQIRDFDLEKFLADTVLHNEFKLRKMYGKLGSFLAEQPAIYKKAKEKLPELAKKWCFFTKKSFEQASGSIAARYKSGLFSGNVMLDLTGGLGADDYAFANSFNKIISLDNDKFLNAIVRINFGKLGVKNIERIDADAYDYIKNDNYFDLVYLDADRRSSPKKSINLEGSEPDILKIIGRLFELTPSVLLKLSPLIDITYLRRVLDNIKDILVISVKNEIKELLVTLVNECVPETIINAVDLGKEEAVKVFSVKANSSVDLQPSDTGKYFYEPSVSIIKAALVSDYAVSKNLNQVSVNSVFLIGNTCHQDFMGRVFEIISRVEFGKSAVKKYLKGNCISKANVSCRNFPVKENEIKKTLGIKDGGDEYLFFTTGINKQKLLFHCRKVN
jgi:THUMP domain-containing protein